MQNPILNPIEKEVVKAEPVKATLVNTNNEPVAPMTTANQVIYNGGTIIDAFDEAYNRATSAYSQANEAYNKANGAYSEAGSAYSRANSAYSLASTNLGYLQDVKNIFHALAGTMYNPGTEGSMGSINGGSPTVSRIKSDLTATSGRANLAYDIATAAYHIAGSIYNRESGQAADTYSEGTYLLKATVDSNTNITFTWVNEADYKNVHNN